MEPGPMEIIKIKSLYEVPDDFTGIVEYPDGTQEWYLNGKLHREDGPAMIFPDGHQCWYKNGEWHRENGPAVITPDGTKLWYLNDEEVSAMEVFDQLPDDVKERELWNLDNGNN